MTPRSPKIGLTAGLFALTALAAGCATGGGDEDRPPSDVTVEASHHLFGVGGLRFISKFPIPESDAGTDIGVFTMYDTGDYGITREGSEESPLQAYSLADDGSLSVVVPVRNSSPTRFVGAYRQGVKVAQLYFFTDRFAPPGNPRTALFWGTRISDEDKDGEVTDKSYYLFAQHVVFSSSNVPDKDDVGRAVAGEITVNSKNDVDGTAMESSGFVFPTLLGTASEFSHNSVDFSIDFKKKASDIRTLRCAQSEDVILGIDNNKTGDEDRIGLVALIEKRELKGGSPPTNLSQSEARKLLAGTFHLGLQKILVAPQRSGLDAALGTIELNEQGGFTLKAVDSHGPGAGTIEEDGTYTFVTVAGALTNKIELEVKATRQRPAQKWIGAVDAAYGVIVIVDNDIEKSEDPPELNLIIATRVVDK